MFFNERIPLETALEMFDDPHIRHEIIEDYHAAYERQRLHNILADLALKPGEQDERGHKGLGS